jgi:hypothetical protein
MLQGLGPNSTTARSLVGDRFGTVGGSAGLRGAQQHVSPQSMPHLQWCSPRAARADLPFETEAADASIPLARHRTIMTSVASDGHDREVREWDGRSANGPCLCEGGGVGRLARSNDLSYHLRCYQCRQGAGGIGQKAFPAIATSPVERPGHRASDLDQRACVADLLQRLNMEWTGSVIPVA